MSYALRFYAVLPSGELKQIGAQTLQKIVEGTQACVLEVGFELKVIQVMCTKEGRTLKSIVHVTGAKYPLLPTRTLDREDYLQKILNVMDKKEEAAKSELAWAPSAEQIKEVALKLGVPA